MAGRRTGEGLHDEGREGEEDAAEDRRHHEELHAFGGVPDMQKTPHPWPSRSVKPWSYMKP